MPRNLNPPLRQLLRRRVKNHPLASPPRFIPIASGLRAVIIKLAGHIRAVYVDPLGPFPARINERRRRRIERPCLASWRG